MPRNILYYEGRFMEWTTVADGPCTEPLSRSEMFDHLWKETGWPFLPKPDRITPENLADREADMKADAERINRRLNRAERMGTSCMLQTEPLRTVYVQEWDKDAPLSDIFQPKETPNES